MDNTVNYIGGFIFPAILVLIIAYLLGSVNFSIILTRIIKKDDIRNYGSGNAGATNMLRAVGKRAAGLTFLLDFVKCAAAVTVGRLIISAVCSAIGAPPELANLGAYFAGLACIIGHMFPVYFGFRGGKGVVTTAAMMVLIDWRVFILLFSVFLIVFAIRRIVSLASIVGTALYPVGTFIITYLFDYSSSPFFPGGRMSLEYLIIVTVLSALTGAVVVIKHRSNIKRLIAGTEKPISLKKTENSPK